MIWEYLDDGGLWQACSEEDNFKIEAHFFEGSQQFHLGDYHYHLSHMTRAHPQTKNNQRIKRTLFVQERRDGECVCACVCCEGVCVMCVVKVCVCEYVCCEGVCCEGVCV